MRKGPLWALAVWFLSTGQLLAQAPATGAASPPPAASATDEKAAAADAPKTAEGSKTVDASKAAEASKTGETPKAAEYVGPMRCWVRPEYLLWWVKNAPLPVPLVTTGNPAVGFDPNAVNTVNTAGAIGQPGTQVLLGDQRVRVPSLSGMRLTLGGWIDDDAVFGLEGSGFALARVTNSFSVTSDKAGNPPLYFPIFSAIAGAERAVPIADPLRGFSGDVVVNSTLRLWGADWDGILTLFHSPGMQLSLLTGGRYADLREHLQIQNTTTDLIFDNTEILNDSFVTRNQFYGGQIGGKLFLLYDRFTLDVTGKVALGITHQVVDVAGNITQIGPNPLTPPGAGTFPGGLFAQTSNSGHRVANPFSVLPSLELKLGYVLNPRARILVGYDLMAWDRVVRPGDQIDHNVNLTQNAVLDPNGVGRLVGPAQPAPLFKGSDLWVQGLSLGVEVLY
jgi:hypothetical protein